MDESCPCVCGDGWVYSVGLWGWMGFVCGDGWMSLVRVSVGMDGSILWVYGDGWVLSVGMEEFLSVCLWGWLDRMPAPKSITVLCCIFSIYIYASAFGRQRHYVFVLSVHPSVRSPKYPLSTCTWVRWSIWLTMTILRPVRLQYAVQLASSQLRTNSLKTTVHPDRFQEISRRMHGEKGLKLIRLIYPDHLQNWLDYSHSLLIFLILALFWPSEMGQIWGYQAFPRKRLGGMAWNFACWCVLTTFRTD